MITSALRRSGVASLVPPSTRLLIDRWKVARKKAEKPAGLARATQAQT
jgi:hypothetical protein